MKINLKKVHFSSKIVMFLLCHYVILLWCLMEVSQQDGLNEFSCNFFFQISALILLALTAKTDKEL